MSRMTLAAQLLRQAARVMAFGSRTSSDEQQTPKGEPEAVSELELSPPEPSQPEVVEVHVDHPVIIPIYQHHKCFSSWFLQVLTSYAEERCISYWHANYQPDHGMLAYDFARETGDRKGFVYLRNSNTRHNLRFDVPSVHMVRDPRDVLVSGYFSHRNTHGTDGWDNLRKWRDLLQSIDQKQGLLMELDFSENFFDDMNSWTLDEPNVLHLKGEDVTRNPYIGFSKILHHLELNPEGIRDAIEANTFDKLSGGRKTGEVCLESHYRKGVPGDWVNYFDEELKDKFKQRYNEVVVKYGYETDDNW